MNASILPSYERHVLRGFPKAEAFYFLMPPPSEAPDSSLSYMMGLVHRRVARGKGRFMFRKGRPQWKRLYERLKKEKGAVVLHATAFALAAFLEALKQDGASLDLPRGSRLMETGGFKGIVRSLSKAELYRRIEHRLGVPPNRCVSEYGMTELSSQYYGAGGGPFRGPAWLRAIVVDPDTEEEMPAGRAGALKHVDLANLGSAAAVLTEDSGRAVPGGFELLGRVKHSDPRGCSLPYEALIGSPA